MIMVERNHTRFRTLENSKLSVESIPDANNSLGAVFKCLEINREMT